MKGDADNIIIYVVLFLAIVMLILLIVGIILALESGQPIQNIDPTALPVLQLR